MTSACVTSFLMMTSAVAVMTLWVTCVVTTAQVSSSTMSWSVAGADHTEVTDEAVCRTRYLSSANGSEADDRSHVVAMAAILELRRPVGGGCGAVSAMELQTVAALFWAVRRLNDQPPTLGLGPYIPGMRLELRVYDDCSHDVLAARHVGQLLSSHPDFNCTPATPPLAGFLGTTTSHTTSFVASLLSRTRIPHFGTSATVSVLSNSTAFPTFFRTVPSDVTQSKVLVDLVQRLHWTYVVGIYTRDNYGTEGFQEFKRLAVLAGVCVFKEKSFWHSDQDVEDSMERFIRELLIELGNTRFSSLGVIYFGHDTEATILFKMIQDRRSRWHNQDKINQLYWLVSDGVGTSLTIASLVEPYTLLSISPATSHLQDVMDFFFHALDHPEELGPYWNTLVTEYLQKVQGCFDTSSPVSSCKLRDKIENYDYLPAALDSFYSLAVLLSRGHQKACGGSSSGPGLCKNMSDVLKQGLLSLVQPEAMNYSRHFSLERLPSRFRQDRMLVPDQFGDFMPANSPLYFINFASNGKWTKIGEYCNGSLTFNQTSQLANIPRSECGTDCQQCRKPGVIRYAFQPGDVLLLGLYSISSPAKDPTSFACGDYRKQSSSVAALLAFLHSIQTLAGTGDVAGGRRFGALVLDDCYNKLTASALLADLYSGKTVLRDPSTGEPIDMQKVVAVIGSQSSSVTLSALSLLTPLQVPSISYSATSPDLDDRLSYPYFLRPVPSDSLQARALVDLVKMLNITYVGALHQNNNYGWRGIQTFVSLAHEVGICVDNPVPVNAGDSEVDLYEALRDIRSKDAKVVVVFLVEPTVLKLLDAIRSRNLDLIFLASEAWTLSADTLHNHRGMTARGSLVLTVDTSREAGNIKMADYLKELRTPAVATTQELPWMRDFWENEKQCNLPGGFTNSYTQMCAPDTQLGNAVVQELAGDQKVVQTINAVTSVTTALQQRCGNRSDPAACMKALPAGQATTLIRSVHLRDQNGQTFRPYLNNGNGNVGFTLHNVQKTAAGTYSYVKVGRYHPELGLQLQRKIVFYNLVGQPVTEPISSSCRYKLQCRSVCGQSSGSTPLPPVTATPPLQREEGEDGGLVAAVVLLALLCAALVALLVAMVCCAKRRGRIPFLGVVKRQENGGGGRMPGRGRRGTEGETNLGFMRPISPRDSLPLPPVPGSSIEGSDHYIDPCDGDRRFSGSSGVSSSPRAASPALYEDRSHYDYAEGERAQRRPPRHQIRPPSQHQDLRRQIQELVKPQQHRFQPSPSPDAALAAAGKDRPRARSVPRVDRPHFLPVHSLHQRGADVNVMNPQEMVQPGRPRSYSHDAAFRARLGALSDDEQQILLKYLQISRQQDRSPHLPPKSEKLPPASEVAEEAERPTFFLQPEQAPAAQAQPEDVASPNAVFGTPPPPFCSSRRARLGGRAECDPGLLYLHAVPTEKDLYLEVIADPSDPSPHPNSPPSHSPAVNTPTSSSSPTAVSTVRASSGSGDRDAPSKTPSSSSVLPAKTLQSPMSVTSPLTSVPPRGSTASESSGAVFMSPDQEFPPLLKYSAPSPKTVSPGNAVTLGADTGSASAHPVPPQFFPVVVHEEGRASPGVPLLSSSPTQQPLLVSGAVHGGSPSAASPLSTPQTSPQNAAGVPGMFVRDTAGNIFWLPGVMVPSSQSSASVSSASSPPAAVVFPQGTGFVSPQFQRGDSAPSPLPSASHSQPAMALTPECTRQISVTVPSASTPQTPVTLTPNLTPTYRQPTPATTLTPPASKQQNLQSRSKKPRMGVDSLSAQRKLSASDVRDANPNSDNELLRTADPGSHPLTSESTRVDPETSTWNGSSVHPGSPQRTQASGFGGTATGIPSPQEGVLRIVEQSVAASPSPCKPLDSSEVTGSGGSNQTSGDSGTGEDLNSDAVNVDSGIEVCV